MTAKRAVSSWGRLEKPRRMKPEKRLPLALSIAALSIAAHLWETREQHLGGGFFPSLLLSKCNWTGKLVSVLLESSYCVAVFHCVSISSISYVFSCKSPVAVTFIEDVSLLSFKQASREKTQLFLWVESLNKWQGVESKSAIWSHNCQGPCVFVIG